LLKDIKNILNTGKNYIKNFEEWLSVDLIKKYQFHSFEDSLKRIHFPDNLEDVENKDKYRKRLSLDELISNYFAIRYLKE
jgi:RecG-like helicase